LFAKKKLLRAQQKCSLIFAPLSGPAENSFS
jgi:hypothetical protein